MKADKVHDEHTIALVVYNKKCALIEKTGLCLFHVSTTQTPTGPYYSPYTETETSQEK